MDTTVASPLTLTVEPGRRMLDGEDAGRAARTAIGLDTIDRGEGRAVLRIETPIVTSSFIRGLLGPSVQSLGLEGFSQKYSFAATSGVREAIVANAEYVAFKLA